MVRGYHIIFSAYGFWLPNDPRGSWSDFVGAWELFLAAGKATKTDERRSVAGRQHDREARLAAKESLTRPAVKFNGLQARAIGRGFANYVAKSGLQVWACSIMPEHVHLVTGPFRLSVEPLVIQLKGAATKQLIDEKIHRLKITMDAMAAVQTLHALCRLQQGQTRGMQFSRHQNMRHQ